MVKNEFLGLDFKDERLNARCNMIVCCIKDNLKASFPEMAGNWSWLKGLYRFMSNPKVTKENLVETHIKNSVKRCMKSSVVLAIQDTTTISFESAGDIDGLGYVNDKPENKGFLVHGVLALNGDTGKPLGILHQQVIVRKQIYDKKETYSDRLKRKRESEKWLIALEKTHNLLNEHKHIVHVSDRESDIYFFIKAIRDLKDGFVIRGCRNRYTSDGYLIDGLVNAVHKGELHIEIPHKGGRKKRTAKADIYSQTVEILAPKVINKNGPPITVNILRVIEYSEEKNKVEWILLTSEPIETLADCEKVIWYYKNRWQIEDFHKGLKTGCSIEERQLGTIQQHEKLLSIFSVFAWHGLVLRFNAKQPKCEDVELNEVQIKILQNQYPRYINNFSSETALKLIAMLGGFIGRKSDGNPGWKSILTGLFKLELMEIGFRLGNK